jgi:hypothetical protein
LLFERKSREHNERGRNWAPNSETQIFENSHMAANTDAEAPKKVEKEGNRESIAPELLDLSKSIPK